MAALEYDAQNVRPYTDVGWVNPGRIAGEALALGKAVAVQSDGTVDLAGASTANAEGVVISISNRSTLAAAGDTVGIMGTGLIAGFKNMTPGARVFLNASGVLGTTGTVDVGYSYTAELFMAEFGNKPQAS